MTLIDSYIVHLALITPLLGALFITLIPASDTGSKIAISKFFSLAGFLFIVRLVYLFVHNQIPEQQLFSFNLIQFNINFIISINKNNILLFLALSFTLLADMFLYEFNDTKSNTHHVAPFLLTFILFISLGQKDIRVALPVLSIANFILYFMIGQSGKKNRGLAIFHSGIFIATCDTLSLIILQLKPVISQQSSMIHFMEIAILLPGLARITLPVFAPFFTNLFNNLDESEGPFILSFLHTSGFFLLLLVRNQIMLDTLFLATIIGFCAVLGALFIAFIVIQEKKLSILPYYFLATYSAFSASFIYLIEKNKSWSISGIIFIISITLFMYTSKIAIFTERYKNNRLTKSKISALWFLNLNLMTNIPGLGIGVITWPMLYTMYKTATIFPEPWCTLWYAIVITWIITIVILAYGFLLKSVFEENTNNLNKEPLLAVSNAYILSPIFVCIITYLIYIFTTYVANKLA